MRILPPSGSDTERVEGAIENTVCTILKFTIHAL